MDGKKKRLVILLAGLFMLILGGTVLAVMGRDTSLDVDQVKQMRKDLLDKMRSDEGKEMTAEQRRDMWKEYNKTVKNLPFEKRKQLFQEKEQKALKRLEPFYALESDEDKKAYLDKQIQDGDQRRKDRDAKRQANGDNNAKAQAGGENGEGGDANSTRPQRDPNIADAGHRENLQMESPEQRAMKSDYRYQMKQEAQALGLPVPRGGGGGGGGGRGGRGGAGGGGGGGQPAAPPAVMP